MLQYNIKYYNNNDKFAMIENIALSLKNSTHEYTKYIKIC